VLRVKSIFRDMVSLKLTEKNDNMTQDKLPRNASSFCRYYSILHNGNSIMAFIPMTLSITIKNGTQSIKTFRMTSRVMPKAMHV
jgi:hypothetical protein